MYFGHYIRYVRKWQGDKLQQELDEFYNERVKGVFIRSRLKWIEEDGKNSTFFLSIEKRNIETNSLSKLKTEDSITEDYTVISKYASHFYADLYKNDVCKSSSSIFNSLKDVKKASDSFKEECDATLSIEENLKLNKLVLSYFFCWNFKM